MRCVVFELAGGHICAPPGRARLAQTPGRARVKLARIIMVSKLQGIDLFYYLLDLREFSNSNDMHKSLSFLIIIKIKKLCMLVIFLLK